LQNRWPTSDDRGQHTGPPEYKQTDYAPPYSAQKIKRNGRFLGASGGSLGRRLRFNVMINRRAVAARVDVKRIGSQSAAAVLEVRASRQDGFCSYFPISGSGEIAKRTRSKPRLTSPSSSGHSVAVELKLGRTGFLPRFAVLAFFAHSIIMFSLALKASARTE